MPDESSASDGTETGPATRVLWGDQGPAYAEGWRDCALSLAAAFDQIARVNREPLTSSAYYDAAGAACQHAAGRPEAPGEPGLAPRFTFTRDQLVDALTRLKVTVKAGGPAAGLVNAEQFADALLEALDG